MDVAPPAGADTLLQQNTTSISREEYIPFYIQKKNELRNAILGKLHKWHLNPYFYITYGLFFLQDAVK